MVLEMRVSVREISGSCHHREHNDVCDRSLVNLDTVCVCRDTNLQGDGGGAGRSVEKEQPLQKIAGTQSCSQLSTEHVDHLQREKQL